MGIRNARVLDPNPPSISFRLVIDGTELPGIGESVANAVGLQNVTHAIGRKSLRDAVECDRLPCSQPNTVVVYCQGGVQASWDYYVARYLGYQVKMYDGSFIDWSRRGADYPVER